jgi:hypothetical protein
MRILRQRALIWAIWTISATSTALAQEPRPDSNVIQAHLLHKNPQPACPEVNVVVEMEQPKCAPKADSSTCPPNHRCSLLGKHARSGHGAPAGYGAVGNIIYTPAAFNLNQGVSNVVSTHVAPTGFTTNVDLSALRSLQEMNLHAAAYNAQRAAQQAATDYMDQEASRLQSSLQKFSAPPARQTAGAASSSTLNEQLGKIDTRLGELEKLVQAHHDTLRILVERAPKKVRGTISAQMNDQFTLTDGNGVKSVFMVDETKKVWMIDKDGHYTAKTTLDMQKISGPVIVTYEAFGDQKFAKEIQIAP